MAIAGNIPKPMTNMRLAVMSMIFLEQPDKKFVISELIKEYRRMFDMHEPELRTQVNSDSAIREDIWQLCKQLKDIINIDKIEAEKKKTKKAKNKKVTYYYYLDKAKISHAKTIVEDAFWEREFLIGVKPPHYNF